MSNTGLTSGIFGQLSEYSIQLNQVLVDLKAGGASTRFSPPEPIKELVSLLSEQWHAELAIQALQNELNFTSNQFDRAAVLRLQEAFLQASIYPEIVDDLEGLAKLVRAQQTGAYFRLRHPK